MFRYVPARALWPLPTWVWLILIVVGGYLWFRVLRRFVDRKR
jgi:hypothetical protein